MTETSVTKYISARTDGTEERGRPCRGSKRHADTGKYSRGTRCSAGKCGRPRPRARWRDHGRRRRTACTRCMSSLTRMRHGDSLPSKLAVSPMGQNLLQYSRTPFSELFFQANGAVKATANAAARAYPSGTPHTDKRRGIPTAAAREKPPPVTGFFPPGTGCPFLRKEAAARQSPHPEVAQMAAPGTPGHKDGYAEQCQHEKPFFPINRAGNHHKRHGNMELPRHQQGREPPSLPAETGEKSGGKHGPHHLPPAWRRLRIQQTFRAIAAPPGQEKNRPPIDPLPRQDALPHQQTERNQRIQQNRSNTETENTRLRASSGTGKFFFSAPPAIEWPPHEATAQQPEWKSRAGKAPFHHPQPGQTPGFRPRKAGKPAAET